MNVDVRNLGIVCSTICFLAAVGAYGYHEVRRDQLMSQNIESAIVKGIDPMAARCSYAKPSDTICVVYATAPHSVNAPAVKVSEQKK